MDDVSKEGLVKLREHKRLSKKLSENHACYVLITCGKPSADGNMNVELVYEGDTALAAYLLRGAQTFMDEKEEDELLL